MLITLIQIFAVGLRSFHRPEFLDCLANCLPREQVTVHFATRLVSYSESAAPNMPITIYFKDGTTAACNVLIGADGVHSPTRHTLIELAAQKAEATEGGKESATLLREKADAVWSGMKAYRMVAHADKLRALNPYHSALTGSQLVSSNHVSVFRGDTNDFMSIWARKR